MRIQLTFVILLILPLFACADGEQSRGAAGNASDKKVEIRQTKRTGNRLFDKDVADLLKTWQAHSRDYRSLEMRVTRVLYEDDLTTRSLRRYVHSGHFTYHFPGKYELELYEGDARDKADANRANTQHWKLDRQASTGRRVDFDGTYEYVLPKASRDVYLDHIPILWLFDIAPEDCVENYDLIASTVNHSAGYHPVSGVHINEPATEVNIGVIPRRPYLLDLIEVNLDAQTFLPRTIRIDMGRTVFYHFEYVSGSLARSPSNVAAETSNSSDSCSRSIDMRAIRSRDVNGNRRIRVRGQLRCKWFAR